MFLSIIMQSGLTFFKLFVKNLSLLGKKRRKFVNYYFFVYYCLFMLCKNTCYRLSTLLVLDKTW